MRVTSFRSTHAESIPEHVPMYTSTDPEQSIAFDPRPCKMLAIVTFAPTLDTRRAAAMVVAIEAVASKLLTAALFYQYGAVCDRLRAVPSTDCGGDGIIVVLASFCNVVCCTCSSQPLNDG